MGWSITITPPSGYPDVKESIASFSRCSGNLYMSVFEIKDKFLKDMGKDEALCAIKEVIAEIDKGNEGKFSNAYAIAADMAWSGGKEKMREWDQIKDYVGYVREKSSLPYQNYEEFCGYEMRGQIRESAVRFFLYYAAGYQIEYSG